MEERRTLTVAFQGGDVAAFDPLKAAAEAAGMDVGDLARRLLTR